MKLTNSSIFLLRGLELTKKTETLDQSYLVKGLGFQNAYIADSTHENYLDCPLYLLFKPIETAVFNDFLTHEYEVRLLKEDYDYPNGHVVLLFDFPVLFREDYKKILEGRYSEVSLSYKALFPEDYKEGGLLFKTLTYHIFNRSKQLQEEREKDLGLDEGFLDNQELWQKFDIEKETLKKEYV